MMVFLGTRVVTKKSERDAKGIIATSFVLLRIRLTTAESSNNAAKKRKLPAIKPGNATAMLNSGAYGFSIGAQYNGRVMRTEVLVNGSRVDIVPARLMRAWTARSITHRLR